MMMNLDEKRPAEDDDESSTGSMIEKDEEQRSMVDKNEEQQSMVDKDEEQGSMVEKDEEQGSMMDKDEELRSMIDTEEEQGSMVDMEEEQGSMVDLEEEEGSVIDKEEEDDAGSVVIDDDRVEDVDSEELGMEPELCVIERTLSVIADGDEEEEEEDGERDEGMREGDRPVDEASIEAMGVGAEKEGSSENAARSEKPYRDSEGNESLIETENVEDKCEITMIEDEDMASAHYGYAPLKVLVNDRTAEATMKLHVIDGSALVKLFVWSLLACLAAAVLTMVAVGIFRDSTSNGSVEGLNALLYIMIFRLLFSVEMTVVVVAFTIIIVMNMRWEISDEFNPDKQVKKLRTRREAQVIVLFMAWCAWLIAPLNPVITAVDMYAYSISRTDDDIIDYFTFWPRQRYNSVADSFFVTSQFYGVIYLFKWTRLEAIKRERLLRGVLGSFMRQNFNTAEEEAGFYNVRSLKGLIPRMAALYFVCRIGFEIGFDFGMGWVPSIAWISVARYCSESPCSIYPENARAALVVLFCVWDIVLIIWVFMEWWRAKKVLSLYYLLQGRAHLVSFVAIVSCLVLHQSFVFFFGMVAVAATPVEFSFYTGLQNTGVGVSSATLALAVLSWMSLLCYFFLPCDIDIFNFKTFKIPTPLAAETGGSNKKLDTSNSLSEEHEIQSVQSRSKGGDKSSSFAFCRSCLDRIRRLTPFKTERTYLYAKSFDDVFSRLEEEDDSQDGLSMGEKISRCVRGEIENVFVLDAAVLMWNFAHTVYLTGSAKYPQSDPDVLLLVEDKRFGIVEQLFDDTYETATYCAIFDSADMIVISFRGNGSRISSSWNRKCAMQDPSRKSTPTANRSSGAATFPIDSPGMDGNRSEQFREVREVHEDPVSPAEKQGFSQILSNSAISLLDFLSELNCFCRTSSPLVREDLYSHCSKMLPRIVDIVEQLQREHNRPVFLTGHGIAGSFAAFCADSIAEKSPHIPLSVYTFGTPRFCNLSFKSRYEERIFSHFDIANVSDSLHSLSTNELFLKQSTLVRLGTTVLLDSLGNLVIDPDWLETYLMSHSRRKRFIGHEPLSYTTGLMMWAHRMHGSYFRPLWSSSLHEIKLAMNLAEGDDSRAEQPSWQSSVVRSYLATSEVGLGPYLNGACVQVKVTRITGLLAKTSTCIVSCGPQGISSGLWEVGKTNVAVLHERSTLVDLISSERDGMEEDDDKIVGSSRESSQDSKEKGASRSPRSSLLQQQEELQQTIAKKKSRRSLGVDAEALAALPGRFADYSSSEPIMFGTFQKLRPCATIIIAAVDISYGNFGKVSLPITKLFPIPHDRPKQISFELSGRARKEDAGELKVHLEVQSIGQTALETMCDSRSMGWDVAQDGLGGGDTLLGNYLMLWDQEHQHQQQQVNRRLQPKVRLSPAMATFYLKRNFNRNSQRIVLRVGVIKGAFRTLDLKMGNPSIAEQVFCELKLGNEHAKSRGSTSVHNPDWNELFTFGKAETLTGFEDLRVEFYAAWPVPSLGPSIGSTEETGLNQMTIPRSNSLVRTSTWSGGYDPASGRNLLQQHSQSSTGVTLKSQLLGVIEIPLSAIITKFQDNLLTKWMPLEPLSFHHLNSSQLSGHVCFCFEVGTEALVEKGVQRRGTQTKISYVPQLGEFDEMGTLGSPSSSNRSGRGVSSGRKMVPAMVRHASGSLRQIISMAASPMSSNFRSMSSSGPGSINGLSTEMVPNRQRTESSSTASLEDTDFSVISQIVPEDWRSKCNDIFDERRFVVKVFIIRAENLEQRFWSEYNSGNTVSSIGSSSSIESPSLDPFCRISLLDPLNDYLPIQSRKTVIIRDNSSPVWEEEFVFGKNRESPVRGNEILSISVHHWELRGDGFKFGEVRLPLLEYMSKLSQKESRVSTLEMYDEKTGEVLPQPGATCEIAFAFIVDEFIDPKLQASNADDSSNLQLSKSPML